MAGVSQSTVSLVLSERWQGRISEPTAQRVRAAADELGYRPNPAAQALRNRSSGTLLVVVPVLTNPFFGYLVAGITRTAALHGLRVVVAPMEAEDGSGPLPLPRQVLDGVITCSIDGDPSVAAWRGTPWVALDCRPSTTDLVLGFDLTGGFEDAVAHVFERGHRRLAYVHPGRGTWTFATRLEAVRRAAEALPDVSLSVVATGFALPDVVAVMRALLDVPDRPTAVLCANDIFAQACYRAAADLGLRIPDQLAVVGCDDLPSADLMTPPLTTIRLPVATLGALAVQALTSGSPGPAGMLATELVVRGST